MIDLTRAHMSVVRGLTLPEGLRPLDEHYLTALLYQQPPFRSEDGDAVMDEYRLDKVEIASDSEYLGIYCYMSRFIIIGNWLGSRYLQIMTKYHLYSEHGQEPGEDDPYDVPEGPITYREVDLPMGVWRTALNDPARHAPDYDGKWANVNLHLDWIE